MDNRPIGIFDSGLGGLTALMALERTLPDENIVYFADTGRCPYGTKDTDTLRKMAMQDLEFLCEKGCKAILTACGTVSANAEDMLKTYHIPVFNVLTPTVEKISEIYSGGNIAVSATEACIRSGAFQSKLEMITKRNCCVLGIPCQNFVMLCESGHINKEDPILKASISSYLGEARDKGTSILLLGCTHFGIIEEAISGFMGRDTTIVAASDCGADAIASYIIENNMQGNGADRQFFTSGSASEFDRMASVIMKGRYDGKAKEIPVMHV